MSLVDDLLIEAERRRAKTRATPGPRLDDLVPVRRDAASRGTGEGARVARWGLLFAAAIAGTATVAAIFPAAPLSFWQSAAAGLRSRSALAPLPTPPPVAARPAEVAAPAPPALEPPATPARSETNEAPASVRETTTPHRVEALTLEPLATGVRLRLVSDAEAPHRIEHVPGATRFDVVLPETLLAAPDAPLDLRGTPIRSLDLIAEGPDLRLALELDPQVRVQSRWLALPVGAALVVELQSPAAAAIDAVAPSRVAARETPAPIVLPFSIDPAFEQSERDRLREPADRIVSPPLGDPAELRIARSARDQARAERRALRARVAALLEDARSARAAGRLDEADALYGEIASTSPGDSRALVEWSELLAESGRSEKARVLLETARERAPRDPLLLLAQARLLGDGGELRSAIGILEASGLSLTESPDVHALAAAYHQRAGDHAAAIDRYERLLRRFPEEARSWLGLGISLEAVGRRDEARDVYRIALQVGELPATSRRWLTTRLSALGQEG